MVDAVPPPIYAGILLPIAPTAWVLKKSTRDHTIKSVNLSNVADRSLVSQWPDSVAPPQRFPSSAQPQGWSQLIQPERLPPEAGFGPLPDAKPGGSSVPDALAPPPGDSPPSSPNPPSVAPASPAETPVPQSEIPNSPSSPNPANPENPQPLIPELSSPAPSSTTPELPKPRDPVGTSQEPLPQTSVQEQLPVPPVAPPIPEDPVTKPSPSVPRPSPATSPRTTPEESIPENLPQPSDPDLGNLRLRDRPSPSLTYPEAEMDPELGTLRIRVPETPVAPKQSMLPVYLIGGVSYLHSDNTFATVDPITDQAVRSRLMLLTSPTLGPQTLLFASAETARSWYRDQADFDYNELRFQVGLRQGLTRRVYMDVSWLHQQFFLSEGGDRFLRDQTALISLNRQDSLAKNLILNTFYAFQANFSDPQRSNRLRHALGVSLTQTFSQRWQVGLDSQIGFTQFTGQDRQDLTGQVLGRLSYQLLPSTRISVFGGIARGSSSNALIDFNNTLYGVSLDMNLRLF